MVGGIGGQGLVLAPTPNPPHLWPPSIFYPRDGDGFISAEELRLAMAEMGQELSSKEAEDLLKEADSNSRSFQREHTLGE